MAWHYFTCWYFTKNSIWWIFMIIYNFLSSLFLQLLIHIELYHSFVCFLLIICIHYTCSKIGSPNMMLPLWQCPLLTVLISLIHVDMKKKGNGVNDKKTTSHLRVKKWPKNKASRGRILIFNPVTNLTPYSKI